MDHRYRGTVISKPCRIESVCVEYYADGIDDAHLVYRDSNVHSGDAYAPVDAALEAAGKKPCNLDAHFGEDAASGFTGWFKDTILINPAASLEIPEKGALKLYGRNRCTLRVDYADGSLKPEEGVVYVSKPKDGASPVEGALELPDFSDVAESHSLDGIELPAIGDNGAGHMAAYYGERISFAAPTSVYRKMGDGTWRHIVCDAYLTDKAGGVVPAKHQDGAGHYALHQVALRGFGRRRQRKEINISRDGGADSVPSPRASLTEVCVDEGLQIR